MCEYQIGGFSPFLVRSFPVVLSYSDIDCGESAGHVCSGQTRRVCERAIAVPSNLAPNSAKVNDVFTMLRDTSSGGYVACTAVRTVVIDWLTMGLMDHGWAAEPTSRLKAQADGRDLRCIVM